MDRDNLGGRKQLVRTNSEIQRALSDSDSDTGSLFSSGGESEYHPSSDNSNYSDSELNSNSEDIEHELDLNAVMLDAEVIPADENYDNLANDENIQFVVGAVHDHYENVQGLWSNTNNVPQALNFTGCEIINIQAATPIEVFDSTFDDALLDKVVNWTNKRAAVFRGQPQSKYATLSKWTDVSRNELKKFLGLTILMGNLGYPSLKHYWSKDPLYEHPLFGKTMPRNRYESILKCLCFYDAETDPIDHKMHKIDQVLNHILENCNNVYSPGQSLSLDEAMVLFRGRLSFRQYIKNKSHQYGIKLYELCTFDGFILNILIYEGKGTLQTIGKGHTYEVVMKLMENFLGKGHIVFLDNFYNSVMLAEDLLSRQTKMCGTLQSHRAGNPREVVDAKLKKGEVISRQKGDVTVLKWRDKRNVLTISTSNGPEMEIVTNKRGTEVRKPSMVVAYNKGMSGIDRSDQMISYYSTPRKSLRWYIKIFFHLMDVALWNSTYITHKLNLNQKKITYLEFRDLVIKNYVGDLEVRRPLRPSTSSSSAHLPVKLAKRVRCHVCRTALKKRTDTFFTCSTCKDAKSKPLGLCMPLCFNKYHGK